MRIIIGKDKKYFFKHLDKKSKEYNNILYYNERIMLSKSGGSYYSNERIDSNKTDIWFCKDLNFVIYEHVLSSYSMQDRNVYEPKLYFNFVKLINYFFDTNNGNYVHNELYDFYICLLKITVKYSKNVFFNNFESAVDACVLTVEKSLEENYYFHVFDELKKIKDKLK
jgi:hypothetical protein